MNRYSIALNKKPPDRLADLTDQEIEKRAFSTAKTFIEKIQIEEDLQIFRSLSQAAEMSDDEYDRHRQGIPVLMDKIEWNENEKPLPEDTIIGPSLNNIVQTWTSSDLSAVPIYATPMRLQFSEEARAEIEQIAQQVIDRYIPNAVQQEQWVQEQQRRHEQYRQDQREWQEQQAWAKRHMEKNQKRDGQ